MKMSDSVMYYEHDPYAMKQAPAAAAAAHPHTNGVHQPQQAYTQNNAPQPQATQPMVMQQFMAIQQPAAAMPAYTVQQGAGTPPGVFPAPAPSPMMQCVPQMLTPTQAVNCSPPGYAQPTPLQPQPQTVQQMVQIGAAATPYSPQPALQQPAPTAAYEGQPLVRRCSLGIDLERHVSVDSSTSSNQFITASVNNSNHDVQVQGGYAQLQPLKHQPQAAYPPMTAAPADTAAVAPQGNVKMVLEVAQADFGVLVGKNAATLRALRDKCGPGVIVTVPRSNSPVGSKVALEGPLDGCVKAKSEIEQILGTPVGGAYGYTGAAAAPVHEGSSSTGGSPGDRSPVDDALHAAGSRGGWANGSPMLEGLPPVGLGRSVSNEELIDARAAAAAHYPPPAGMLRKVGRKSSLVSVGSSGGEGKKEPKRGLASLQPGHVMHPDDWECDDCGNMNWASRRQCNRCGKDKVGLQSNVRFFVSNVSVHQRMAGSCKGKLSPADGDLLSNSAWVPDMTCPSGNWYCLDAGTSRVVGGVAIKCGTKDEYVTSFTLQYSACGSEWSAVDAGAVYQGCTEGEPSRNVMFLKPLMARYVKVLPKTWRGAAPALRCGLVLCITEKEKVAKGARVSGGSTPPSAGKPTHSIATRFTSPADRELAKAAAKEKLTLFFTSHNPKKLDCIDTMLDECEKANLDYASLYRKLENKYAIVARRGESDSPAPVSTVTCLVVLTSSKRSAKVKVNLDTVTAEKIKNFVSAKFDVAPAAQTLTSRGGADIDCDFVGFKEDLAKQGVVFCEEALGDLVSSDDECVAAL